MNRPTLFRFFLPLLLIAAIIGSAQRPAPDFAAIDAYAEAEMRSGNIPGLAYAIVDHGQVVHTAAFGVADSQKRALTADTPMLIGSVGKTITALAVRQLAEEGKLSMDARLIDYLPWFKLATPGAAEQITVQNLLDHKSGISKFDGQDLARYYRPGLTAEEIARSLSSVHTNRPVGAEHEYSNLNYVLLGLVVEAASGQSYAEYIQEHIFQPIGMTHSYTSYEQARAQGLAEGYHYLFGFPSRMVEPYPTGMVAAGYHISSVHDMARYLAALSNGGVIDEKSIVTADGKLPERLPTYNVYWEPKSMAPGDSPNHSGTTLNYNATIEYVANERVGVVVMLNSNPQQFLNAAKGASNITNDILRKYLGITPLLPRAPGVARLFAYVDAVLLLILTSVVLNAISLRQWQQRIKEGPRRRSLVARALLANGLLPLAIVLGFPLLLRGLGFSTFFGAWPFLFTTLADIASVLIIAAIALLLVGLIKLRTYRKVAAI